jgi:hypothetical protein
VCKCASIPLVTAGCWFFAVEDSLRVGNRGFNCKFDWTRTTPLGHGEESELAPICEDRDVVESWDEGRIGRWLYGSETELLRRAASSFSRR